MTFDEYQKFVDGISLYPGRGTALGVAYIALKLNGEAGEFAEHVGKAGRDENFFDSIDFTLLEDSRRSLLLKELGDVLWYVTAGAAELGVDLETIAEINVQKLLDRQGRNALTGSGDNR